MIAPFTVVRKVSHCGTVLILTCLSTHLFSQEPQKDNTPSLSNHNVYGILASVYWEYAALMVNYEKKISAKGHLLLRGAYGRTIQDDGYNFFVVGLTAISKPLRGSHFEFTIGFQTWPYPNVPAVNIGYRYQKPRKPFAKISLGTEGLLLGLGYSFVKK